MALQISAQENFGELGVVVKFCSRVGWIGGVTGESRGREVAHYRDAVGAHCAPTKLGKVVGFTRHGPDICGRQ